MSRFSDVIHAWLGLCPDRHAVRQKVQTEYPAIPSAVPPENAGYTDDHLLVDYGAAGKKTWFFIGVLTSFFGVIVFFSIFGTQASLRNGISLFGIILLLFAIVMFWRDMKRAGFEITRDALILRRPLSRLVIIRQKEITGIEVQDITFPYPLAHQKIMNLFVIPACYTALIMVEHMGLGTGEITPFRYLLDLVFYTSIVLFFVVLYYHYQVRSIFPQALIITTGRKERVAVYSMNPEEMADILGRSS